MARRRDMTGLSRIEEIEIESFYNNNLPMAEGA